MSIKTGAFSEISPCPVCQNRHFRKLFTKKGRDFWKCNSCGLVKQFPIPVLNELIAYYDESYSTGMYKTFIEARKMKKLTAQHRIKEILPHCPSGRWLDIGCSDGLFVETARGKGLDSEGIDFSETAVEAARKEGLPVVCSTVEVYDPGYRYNTITAYDVLEHVIDPYTFLQSIHRLLVPGGKVVLSAPNQGSLVCRIMGRRWYFYIPEEHLHYFSPSTIKRLLLRVGFEVERCARTLKPLTLNYSLTQFIEYNPSIYTLLSFVAKVIPRRLRDVVVPIYIGEMLVIAKR